MRIEGTIIQIYETWPLQLTIRTVEGDYYVSLSDRIRITSGGRSFSMEAMKDGQRVLVEGRTSSEKAIIADSIDILGDGNSDH